MAPEILLEKEITEKSDVYSLGMLLIEMITIEVPYTDFNMTRAGILQKIRDGIEPSLLDRISDVKAKDYIKKMIDPDPSKRPSVHDLLSDQFLEINEKDDNRKIKLIKIKKKKKKKSIRENMENLSGNKLQPVEKKNVVPFKRDFEENPYFEEVLKAENIIECAENLQCENFGNEIKKKRNSDEKKDNIPQKKEHVPEREKIVTSSHEGGPYSKNCSDVYHTANTDYFHQKFQINDKNAILKTEESVNKKSTHQDQCPSSPPYQIFDEHYNVLLKFLISQDGKLHEIQFAYNLLRDNIPDLIEEVQSEFNFSQDNLNHIYETLKKISIYSKFYKQSDILHDNSA
jgi:serine/threonine protein kinase